MRVMGDQIQHKLTQLVNLFHEELEVNFARQEEINAHFDALINNLENSKVDCYSTEDINKNRCRNGKNRVAGGLGLETGGSFIIPPHTNWISHGLISKRTFGMVDQV